MLLFWTAISLVIFFYLLSLHPGVAGRVYVAYASFYVAIALFWVRARRTKRDCHARWYGYHDHL
jgi:drug/metabolite transporter superfamily protein YnfA